MTWGTCRYQGVYGLDELPLGILCRTLDRVDMTAQVRGIYGKVWNQ